MSEVEVVAGDTSHSTHIEEKEHDPFGSPLQPPLLTLLPPHSSSLFEDLNNFISLESSRSLDERLDRDLSRSKEVVPLPSASVAVASSAPTSSVKSVDGEMAMSTRNPHDIEDEMDMLSSSIVRHPFYPHICCYAYKCATEGIIDVSLEEVFQMNEHLFAKVDHERPDGTTVVDELITRSYEDVKMMLEDMKGFSERVESATKKLIQTSRSGDGEDDRDARDQTKIRGRISKRARDTLRTWILEHQSHPYPTKEEKQELAEKTQLTFNQVSGWFVNSRRRFLRQLRGNEKDYLSRESEEEVEEMLEDTYRPSLSFNPDGLYTAIPKVDQVDPRLDHAYQKNSYYHPTIPTDQQNPIEIPYTLAAHPSDPSQWINEIRDDGQDQYASMQMSAQAQYASRASVPYTWADEHAHHTTHQHLPLHHPQW